MTPLPLQVSSLPFPVWPLALLAAVLLSLGVALRIARPAGRWGRRLRSRLLLGVPWGTLVVAAFVAGVYLFVQQGLRHPYYPVVVPFRAWSYGYPLGMLTAAFSHAGVGHVTGNLLGLLAFGPLAEYAWSHFPTDRGSQSFRRPLENPFVRIAVFVAGVLAVGLLTAVFAVGPVIGFSGVVFAIAGFALVYYPIPTVVVLASQEVLTLLYRAVRSPVNPAQSGTQFVTPWWAEVAIQGHAIGLLFGVLLGGAVAARRNHRPTPGRLWLATLVFAVSQSLWAVYWFRGNGRYVLFRAGGAVLVFLLAALVTAAMTASDRTVVDRIDLRSREVAVGLLLSLTVALSVVAVPPNLVSVSGGGFDDGVEVRDYTVTYAEDVPNRYVSAIDVGFFGETTQINTSGVIVTSQRRDAFVTVTPTSRLAYSGRSVVAVGGLGWREVVVANRTGWNTVGNRSVYRVSLEHGDEVDRPVFRSPPSLAESRITGRRVQLRALNESFALAVRRAGRTLDTAAVPPHGRNVTAGGLTFNRTGDRLYALDNGTRVHVATYRTGD